MANQPHSDGVLLREILYGTAVFAAAVGTCGLSWGSWLGVVLNFYNWHVYRLANRWQAFHLGIQIAILSFPLLTGGALYVASPPPPNAQLAPLAPWILLALQAHPTLIMPFRVLLNGNSYPPAP